ncbi:MAG: putative Ig domain-containing protein, partial [Nitrospira sp.]
VKAPGPLTVTTSVLPGGTVGESYNQTLTATGGIPGYVWSLNPGSNPLPLNLSLNPTGVISGVPTTAGTTVITVKVTDSASVAVTKELSLTISLAGAPVAITSSSVLPVGTVGTVYDTRLSASGGTGALSWSAVSALPVWLTLDPSTGQLSGMPPTAGTSTFTIRVQDSGTLQQSDEQVFTLTIGGTDGGGTLTVSNAPASVGGTFAADRQATSSGAGLIWLERDLSSSTPSFPEGLVLFFDLSDRGNTVSFQVRNAAGVLTNNWFCTSNCQGVVTLNRAAGTAIFSTVVVPSAPGFTAPPITLNGTLRFTPF